VSTAFLSHEIWPQLTKASRASRRHSAVAVAYFGKGASVMLPLAKGSRLVVDASERAVASGQTCPADLITLVERGVSIYSVPNLHAKVFVLGRAAYIGSANVSRRAASHLVEAVIRATDHATVGAARQFVEQQCVHEMTPTILKGLKKLWHPPDFPAGVQGKRQQAMTSKRPALPPLRLAQLYLEDYSKQEQALHDAAMPIAKRRQEHPRNFELDSFLHFGKCPYQRKDVVIQVTDEGSDGIWVTPPGNVLYVRTRRNGNKLVSAVCLERPARRRRQLKTFAQAVRCSQKRLRRHGLVRDSAFAQALLNTWAINS
jgi:hypothetical protein